MHKNIRTITHAHPHAHLCKPHIHERRLHTHTSARTLTSSHVKTYTETFTYKNTFCYILLTAKDRAEHPLIDKFDRLVKTHGINVKIH